MTQFRRSDVGLFALAEQAEPNQPSGDDMINIEAALTAFWDKHALQPTHIYVDGEYYDLMTQDAFEMSLGACRSTGSLVASKHKIAADRAARLNVMSRVKYCG